MYIIYISVPKTLTKPVKVSAYLPFVVVIILVIDVGKLAVLWYSIIQFNGYPSLTHQLEVVHLYIIFANDSVED